MKQSPQAADEIPAVPQLLGISATPERFVEVLEGKGTSRVKREVTIDPDDVRWCERCGPERDGSVARGRDRQIAGAAKSDYRVANGFRRSDERAGSEVETLSGKRTVLLEQEIPGLDECRVAGGVGSASAARRWLTARP